MRRIALMLLMVSLPRFAYAVPTGCFITDYSSSCYTGYFLSSDCDQYNMSYYNFGSYISSMCTYVNSIESSNVSCAGTLSVCRDTLTTVVSQRDDATNLFVAAEQNRQEWVAYAGKRDKLIARLYKACGSKCKRIK
jgi:hypothetical protein